MDMKKILDKLTVLSTFPFNKQLNEDKRQDMAEGRKAKAKKDSDEKPASVRSEWMVKGTVDGKTKVISVRASSESEARSSATNNPKFKVVSVRKKGTSVDAEEVDESKNDVKKEFDSLLAEKAVSKKQQKFMGMVHAAQKGEKPASKEVAKVAKTMKKKDAKDFASTKHKGLPEKKKKTNESVMRLTEGRMKELLMNFLDDIDHSGEIPSYSVNDGDENAVFQAVENFVDNTTKYSSLGDDLKQQLIDAAMEHYGFSSGSDDFDNHYDVMDPPEDGEGIDKDEGAFDYDQSLDESSDGSCSPVMGINDTTQNSRFSVSTNMTSDGTKNVTVTADGEQADSLLQLLKLAGLGMSGEQQEQEQVPVQTMAQPNVARMQVVATEGKENRVYDNSPDEKVCDTEHAITKRPSNDLNRPKKQHADKPKLGDNPLATETKVKEGKLWKAYEQLKNGVISLK
jgi:hypothetical protein